MNKRFAAAINCIDGRVQVPVLDWIKKTKAVDYVDMITEPGPDKILSEKKNDFPLRSIRNRVEVSIGKHETKSVFLVGHHACAGNPVDETKHREQILNGVKTITSWDLGVDVVGLWVDRDWRVKLVGI